MEDWDCSQIFDWIDDVEGKENQETVCLFSG